MRQSYGERRFQEWSKRSGAPGAAGRRVSTTLCATGPSVSLDAGRDVYPRLGGLVTFRDTVAHAQRSWKEAGVASFIADGAERDPGPRGRRRAFRHPENPMAGDNQPDRPGSRRRARRSRPQPNVAFPLVERIPRPKTQHPVATQPPAAADKSAYPQHPSPQSVHPLNACC